ncbi:MAG: urea transporter, partial [Coriobacteriia bacterium]|nr:urea transporter [Coriobacteriia bacterium]
MSLLWAGAVFFGAVGGACFVVALVSTRPIALAALFGSALAMAAGASCSARLSVEYGTPVATFVALAFVVAGFTAGYRLVASTLLDALDQRTVSVRCDPPTDRWLVVVLSDAEPARYSARCTAARLRRIERTSAAAFSPTVLPMIFLAERMRYRALRGPHPARYVVEAIATSILAGLERNGLDADVVAAYVDGRPALVEVVRCAQNTVVVEVGPAGSLPYIEARTAAEAGRGASASMRVIAPSVWRDDRLAERLCERIAERVPNDERGSTGIVLLGTGIPEQWRSASTAWNDDENYFLTRTSLMLEEAGFDPQMVRAAWMGWQAPSLAEAVRHAAAIGASRIIVAPATIVYPDLATLLDVQRETRDARVPAHVPV